MPSHGTASSSPSQPANLEELTVAELVERARELAHRSERTLLGITGAPGAGKSTLAGLLAGEIADSAVVGMDGFHLAQQELHRLGREDRKGSPDTFDVYGYASLLGRIRLNREPVVYAPTFRRDLEEPIAGAVAVPQSASLIITEGNYLLFGSGGWPAVRAELDMVWHLQIPDELRLRRLITRHEQFGKDPVAARHWATETDQRNALVVESVSHDADLIVCIREP